MDSVSLKKRIAAFVRSGIHFEQTDGKLAVSGNLSSLSIDDRQFIKDNKDSILAIVSSTFASQASIPSRDPAASVPLSFSQLQLWLIDQIHDGSAHYNMPAVLDLHGPLNYQALQQAFNLIIERHEVLRTTYVKSEDCQPLQIVHAALPLHIQQTDLSLCAAGEQQAELAVITANEAKTPFDLANDLMIRVHLIKRDTERHRLLVTMHHIASDGWSVGLLMTEFSAAYRAFCLSEQPELPALPIQYADYAVWECSKLDSPQFQTDLAYWRKQLQGIPTTHSLPLDFNRPPAQTFSGATYSSRIDTELYAALKTECQQQGASIFMGLHALLAVFLAKYSNEKDIVIGTPAVNRSRTEVEHLIGFFTNTLVLRTQLTDDTSFRSLLNTCRTIFQQALSHQQLPFEKVIEALQPERSMSFSPLFQIMLILDNATQGHINLPGLEVSLHDQVENVAHFDLCLNVLESNEGLQINWEYNVDLFSAATIEKFARHFHQLLMQLLAHPHAPALAQALMSEKETQQLLTDWNNTTVSFPSGRNAIEPILAQVKQRPDAVAVIAAGKQYSYQALEHRSNQLSHFLSAQGVRAGDTVGLYLRPGFTLCAGLLAAMKLNATFVLLDTGYPQARIEYMVQDSGMSHLLYEGESMVLESAVKMCDAHACDEEYATELSPLESLPAGPVCLFYTSGSTGQPKGVRFSHEGLMNYAWSMQQSLAVSEDARFLQLASVGFDVILEELLPCWYGGGCVVTGEVGLAEPEQLQQMLLAGEITCFEISFGHWREWLHWLRLNAVRPPASLKIVMVGCESIPQLLMEQWQTYGVPLVHVFGLTETTVTTTLWHSEWGGWERYRVMPIGKPIANTQVYVLDSYLQPVPVGVAGELYIGGLGVALGYHNKAELSAERFVENPFYDAGNAGHGTHLYKTGDLVRWQADGQLVFLGRNDDQVKIRGFRIELGEVEGALLACSGVAESLVVARAGADGSQQLVGYYRGQAELVELELRAELSAQLPDYMVPGLLVRVERFPLTSNGKIDRKALPEPDLSCLQSVYVAPETALEAELCVLWQDLLGVERVGVLDNFFALGGHSLLVMKLTARLRQEGYNVSAAQVFETPNLQALAGVLRSSDAEVPFKAPARRIPDGCQELRSDMLPLIHLSDRDIERIVSRVPGGVVNIQDIYPLGPLQKGILFHHLLEKEHDPYIMSLVFKVDATLTESLIDGLQFLVNRHDVLRTFIIHDGLPEAVQVVLHQCQLEANWVDLRPAASDQQYAEQINRYAVQKIDITQAPLWRITVGKAVGDGVDYVLFQEHHLINDHVGLEIIQQELLAYLQDKHHDFVEPAQYREFIAFVQHQAGQQDARAFFSRQFADLTEPTLPFGLQNLKNDGSSVGVFSELLSVDKSKQIRALTQKHGLSNAAFFHTVWALVIAAATGRQDIVFGSVFSGRQQNLVLIDRMLGVFINTLPLRVLLQDKTIIGVMVDIQQSLQDLLPYEQTPLSVVNHCSGLAPNTPMFSAMLNYRFSAEETEVFPGLQVLDGEEKTNYPFTLSVDDFSESGLFKLELQIDTSVGATRVAGFLKVGIEAVLDALTSAPDKSASTVSLLPQSEYLQFLARHQGLAHHPAEQCLHERFEAWASACPDATAVVCQGQSLSYRELNERSNQLAHYLRQHHDIEPDTLVGILVDRSLDLVVSVLAVLKAGGAYVPLDPIYPQERISHILQDAALAVVICHQQYSEKISGSDVALIRLDDHACQAAIKVCENSNIDVSALSLTPEHLAYVIYTSGSTGKPKGVLVEHYHVTRLFDTTDAYFSFGPQDVWTLFHSYAFDFSVWEIWGALSKGGKLVVVPYWISRAPDDFHQLLADEQVTVLNQTPSAFRALIEADARLPEKLPLRFVIFGGEALTFKMLAPWVVKYGDASPVLINMYGITETTVHTTYYRVMADDVFGNYSRSVIGDALPDLSLYVLNDQLLPVPDGVVGELYIGGAGVTRGYLNRQSLTDERFIENPFASTNTPKNRTRLYKTGDLVRRGIDGSLEYLGRNDHQVKIRGFRIELGEIEAELLKYQNVEEVLVMDGRVENGGQQLVAYYTASESCNPEQLKDFLQQTLPDYMVPAFFIGLDTFPLTLNGKIDRKALPLPDLAMVQAEYVAPRSEAEILLCQIWQTLLGAERVGVNDNFFALGGHSLVVMTMISQLQLKGFNLEIRHVFEARTLSQLAQMMTPLVETTAGALHQVSQSISAGCQSITPDMLPLVDLTQSEIDEIVSRVPGGVSNIQDIYALAPLQEGMLFHHTMNEEADPYVSPALLKLKDSAALEMFRQAIHFVSDRYDVLRTAVLWRNREVPVQVVLRSCEVPFEFIEFAPKTDVLAAMQSLCTAQHQSMDLESAPLIQVKVAELKETGEYLLLFKHHHLIIDHVSFEHLYYELSLFMSGKAEQLPAPVQYREFVAQAQRQHASHDVKAFFGQYLGDINEPTIPFGLVDTHSDGSQLDITEMILPGELSQRIRVLARQLQVSPAAMFHAAWAMVIGVCSSREDVVFGTVVSGRLQGLSGAEQLMGMTINTLPFRAQLAGRSAESLVRYVYQQLLELLPYEQVSLAEAQSCSQVRSDLPLFSAILNYRHTNTLHLDLFNDSVGLEYIQGREIDNYLFSLSVDDLQDDFSIEVQVAQSVGATRLFRFMQTALCSLVQAIESNNPLAVNKLNLLPAEERNKVLTDWNNTTVSFPSGRNAIEPILAQVKQRPDAVAVIAAGKQYSYQALEHRSNQLSHFLSAQGVRAGDTVGLYLRPGFTLCAGLLAAMKLNATFVLLDTGYPQARIEYMVQDSGMSHLLYEGESMVLESAVKMCDAHACDEEYATELSPLESLPAGPVCLFYTSGSTGQPKGVRFSHEGLMNYAWSMQQSLAVSEDARFLQLASVGFDVILEELLPCWYGGGCVVTGEVGLAEPEQLQQMLLAGEITCFEISFGHWREWLHWLRLNAVRPPASLKIVMVGCESIPQLLMEQWQTYGVPLVHVFGLTETTVTTTLWHSEWGGWERYRVMPIGKPIANTQVYVLDSYLQPVPVGVAGELYIGGLGVALGYHNKAELSAERFVENPFYDAGNAGHGTHLYKTGDLVRWQADGQLVFLGRNDDQVKIRGFRIELGEVEGALLACSGVAESLVVARAGADGSQQLVGYYRGQAELVELELRAELSAQLPDYMVPGLLVRVERFPLTSNGKIDRKALPEPDLSCLQSVYVAPETALEAELCVLWQDLLGVERVGVLDNFFALGGHSLLVMKLTARLRQEGYNVSAAQVFETPNLQALAGFIDATSLQTHRDPNLDVLLKQLTTQKENQTEGFVI